jgi:hypothetical protein
VTGEQPAAGCGLGDGRIGRRELEGAGPAAVDELQPVISRSPATIAPRRATSSSRDRCCIQRITPSPEPVWSGWPAICASYIISPTRSNPGRARIERASRRTSVGSCTGERRTPMWPSTGARHDASASIATRMRARGGSGDGIHRIQLGVVDHERDATREIVVVDEALQRGAVDAG